MRLFSRSSLLLAAFLASAVALVVPHRVRAQSPPAPANQGDPDVYSEEDQTPLAASFLGVSFSLEASGQATAQANFNLSDAVDPATAEIKSALQSAIGCTLQDSTRSREARNFYSGSCHPPLTTTTLLHQGSISTLPLQNFATAHHIDTFTLEIRLPVSEVLETVPPPIAASSTHRSFPRLSHDISTPPSFLPLRRSCLSPRKSFSATDTLPSTSSAARSSSSSPFFSRWSS